jgi:TetR/AcrR family transcriptional regulator, transcriptional repressor for nem operon
MLTARKRTPRKTVKAATARDPERTRTHLLHTAAGEIYRSGFQGTGLDRILASAGVTKGALYHYFNSKEALGYAILDEVVFGITREKWLRPLAESANPIDTLIEIVQGTSLLPEHVEGGCPLNNLSQEMSPLDEGFRKRAARIFRDWRDAIADALRRGQKRGQVRKNMDAVESATFLVALYEGYISLAKNAQDPRVLRSGLKTMARHLETLRA